MPAAVQDTTDYDLDPEKWTIISNACRGLKWWPLVEKMMLEDNVPTLLSGLDDFLRKEEIVDKEERYPTWDIAAPAINSARHKASSPYRLKKVKTPSAPKGKKAKRNAYQGKVHFKLK